MDKTDLKTDEADATKVVNFIMAMSIATDADPTVPAPFARVPILAGLAIYLALLAVGCAEGIAVLRRSRVRAGSWGPALELLIGDEA